MSEKIRLIGIYSAIIGSMYILYGMLEIIAWAAGELAFPLSPSPDIFAGFILVVIGSILLYRVRDLLNMRYEGLSFFFVGLILSAIIGIMYLLIMGADLLDATIIGETWAFDSAAYNLPAIVLFILLLPGWLIIKEREEFGE